MRRFFYLLFFCFILSGCSGFHQFITGISNKNGGNLTRSQPEIKTNSKQNSQCQNWCHNGWCSTHCEATNQ